MTQFPETTVLLDRIRDGDADSVGLLFEQYRPRLREMVRLRMDPRIRARISESDALQDVFLDLTKEIDRYLRNPRVGVYVWLRGIAAQRLQKLHRDHLAAQKRSVGRECQLPHQSSVQLGRQLLAEGTSPSQGVARAELREVVQRAIAGLKPEDREIILMREFEELSNSEVAEVLGLSDSAATMRYGRALHRLKEEFRRLAAAKG